MARKHNANFNKSLIIRYKVYNLMAHKWLTPRE